METDDNGHYVPASKPKTKKVKEVVEAMTTEKEHVNVTLLSEASAKPGMCGRLLRWLYGMRGAAQWWEVEFCWELESLGFKGGENPHQSSFTGRQMKTNL